MTTSLCMYLCREYIHTDTYIHMYREHQLLIFPLFYLTICIIFLACRKFIRSFSYYWQKFTYVTSTCFLISFMVILNVFFFFNFDYFIFTYFAFYAGKYVKKKLNWKAKELFFQTQKGNMLNGTHEEYICWK